MQIAVSSDYSFSDFYADLATIGITDRDRIYKELVVIRVVVEGGKDER